MFLQNRLEGVKEIPFGGEILDKNLWNRGKKYNLFMDI
jgi:hypothetical protein